MAAFQLISGHAPRMNAVRDRSFSLWQRRILNVGNMVSLQGKSVTSVKAIDMLYVRGEFNRVFCWKPGSTGEGA